MEWEEACWIILGKPKFKIQKRVGKVIKLSNLIVKITYQFSVYKTFHNFTIWFFYGILLMNKSVSIINSSIDGMAALIEIQSVWKNSENLSLDNLLFP